MTTAAARAQQPASPMPMLWNALPALDLVNSLFSDHMGAPQVFDRLGMPGWQRAFLEHWGWSAPVPASKSELARLRALRERVRRFLEAAAAGRAAAVGEVAYFRELLEAAPFVYTIGNSGALEIKAAREGWAWAVAGIVRSAFQVATTSDSRRIKKCANPACSWLFYDETQNLSRRWCQVQYCGNLLKVREHRARRRQTATGSAAR